MQLDPREQLHAFRKQFETQPVIIMGLGREGRASYALIRSFAPTIPLYLVDDQPLESLSAESRALVQHDDHITCMRSDDALREIDAASQPGIVLKTAGIASEHPLIRSAEKHEWQITSNTALFFDLLPQIAPEARIIGITGTKGKSTTTSLIFHLLQTAGIPSVLTGNIGTPALETLQKLLQDPAQADALRFVVYELSSHQLRELRVSPDIAVLLNITPEHLDYYPDFETYREAKAAICAYQSATDILIYNPDFSNIVPLADRSPARKLLISSTPKGGVQYAASVRDELVYAGKTPIIPLADLPLVGAHNLHNILPCVALAAELEIDPTITTAAIHSFRPLDHRLNLVAEVAGVQYYNDSQATNPEAAIAALHSFPDRRIHLIAGGSDKGLDLLPFVQEIIEKSVVSVALLPPTGDALGQQITAELTKQAGDLDQKKEIHLLPSNSMSEAVEQIAKHVQPGDVVLLSPAAASFGLFKDYQDRGNQFAAAVRALAQKRS